jgi:hypothetical protein
MVDQEHASRNASSVCLNGAPAPATRGGLRRPTGGRLRRPLKQPSGCSGEVAHLGFSGVLAVLWLGHRPPSFAAGS